MQPKTSLTRTLLVLLVGTCWVRYSEAFAAAAALLPVAPTTSTSNPSRSFVLTRKAAPRRQASKRTRTMVLLASTSTEQEESGGDQYIHNANENTGRQSTLNDCFRDSSLSAWHMAGIIKAAAAEGSENYKVLEIGCGAGYTTIDLANALPSSSAHITAIDTNTDMIKAANALLSSSSSEQYGNTSPLRSNRIDFIEGQGEQVEGQFDAIWMRFVVVHVSDPTVLIRSAVEKLKPGGIILIEDCSADGYFSDPPMPAVTFLHEKHIAASLQLGGDIRRGPLIGGYLREASAGLVDISCNSFAPIFGNAAGVSVSPWLPGIPPPDYQKGLSLLRLSIESLGPKLEELGLATNDEVKDALASLDGGGEEHANQIFTIPGGHIFQWWATKSSV